MDAQYDPINDKVRVMFDPLAMSKKDQMYLLVRLLAATGIVDALYTGDKKLQPACDIIDQKMAEYQRPAKKQRK